jgi:outer membrane receptor for ferrienterochelin and colicins
MLKFKGIGLSIILISVLAQAENINNLDEVTVTTATKTKKNIEGVSASVIVIDEKIIKKNGCC